MLIDFDHLVTRYKVQAKGVLHLGASEGQEAPFYAKHGYKMAFVEALPHIHAKLVQNVAKYGAVTYNACVSDVEGVDIEFNIANNGGQSSSMLEFGTHTKEHPGVRFIGKTRMKTKRVDSLVADIANYDILVMDLQGAELMALKGIGEKLHGFKYVYTEVNKKHLYKGCPLVWELDEYLKGFGFERVETKFTQWGWGDAFYVRKQAMPTGLTQFQPRQRQPYPIHNRNEFEYWFMSNFKQQEGQREYIPVLWTAFQLDTERNKLQRQKLQAYLNSMDRSKKYFTVVQHDDGIKFSLPFDCKVFGMGKESDYPLPLICEPHAYKFENERDIKASFIGNKTHPVRSQLIRLQNQPGYYISFGNHNPKDFCEILSRSVFTLCPRGYGITSFRIMEAIQYGSIPVYISDRFIFPHGIDFNEYGVVVHSSDASRVDQILSQISEDEIKMKQSKLKDIFDKYFTYESNMELIKMSI